MSKEAYTLVTDEQYQDLVEVVRPAGKYVQKYGNNPLYNQKYKDYLAAYHIQKSIDPSIRAKNANKGFDYINDRCRPPNDGGEGKSIATYMFKRKFGYSTAGKFEFEKQDEEGRREEALKCRSFLFTLFDKFALEKIILCIYLNTDEAVGQFIPILKKRVDEYLVREEQWKKEGSPRKRDTASVSVEDILLGIKSGAQYVDRNRSEISREDAIKMIGISREVAVEPVIIFR